MSAKHRFHWVLALTLGLSLSLLSVGRNVALADQNETLRGSGGGGNGGGGGAGNPGNGPAPNDSTPNQTKTDLPYTGSGSVTAQHDGLSGLATLLLALACSSLATGLGVRRTFDQLR